VSLVEHAQIGAVDAVLRRCVERILSGGSAPVPAITHLERAPAPHWGSYDNAILEIRLEDGKELRLFLKDFGRSRLPKDAAAERREREVRVYVELLDGAELGTARFVGSHQDEAAERHWLFLEFVDGEPLRYCGFARWLEAAAWLGRLHGRFAGEVPQLRDCRFLARHDAGFFTRAAERALDTVAGLADALVGRLANVLVVYEAILPVLAAEPDALVHGSYRPQNVLVAGGAVPARICPTDWELAALGRSAHDLAFLVDGFDPPRLEMLFEAYVQEADRSGFPAQDAQDLRHEVDCFRLHKVISSLGHASRWPEPADTATKVIAAGERIAAALR
jgi:Ser/Thr protein kinase RdoA (MazF antagonist)